MTNKEKIQAIINRQLDKLFQLSESSKMPLFDKDIRSLTELAKLVAESETLETKKHNSKFDDLSAEELLLLQEFRAKK